MWCDDYPHAVTHDPLSKNRAPAIRFVFISLLLEVLGFGLLIPVSPKLVQHLLGDVSEAVASPYYSWLMATYAAVQFVFAPTLGALSDRYGRRPVLLLAIFGSGLDYFAMALAPNIAVLFVTRAINGLSGGTMTVCSAYIADVTPPDKRAAGFGILGAAFGLGFILGPLVGGVLGSWHIHLPFYVAGALCILNWIYGYFVLPESLPPERRMSLNWVRMNPISVLLSIGKYPIVRRMAGAWFFLNMAQFALHATWALSMAARYGWKEWEVGLSLAIVGVGAAFVQASLAKKVIARIGERKAMIIGLIIGVCAYAGYGWAPQGWIIYALVAVASIGGIAGPATQAIITKRVRPDEQGRVQGGLTSVVSIAQIIAPIAGGWIFAHYAGASAKPYIPGATFYLGAVLSFIGLLIAIWATRANRHADHVCGECLYPMPTGAVDICPECGKTYDEAGIRRGDDSWERPPQPRAI